MEEWVEGNRRSASVGRVVEPTRNDPGRDKRRKARLITAIAAREGRVGIGIELGVPDQKPGTQRYRMTV